MFISVITTLYHGEKYIDNLLKMINKNIYFCKSQNLEIQIEYILVNDYPIEKIEIENYIFDYMFHIKYYTNEINKGVHYSRVKGLENCSGKYILFLDQDDLIEEDYLYTQITILGKSDLVISNGYQKNAEFKVPIYKKQRTQLKLFNEKNFILRSPIVSPGQCIIKRDIIPNEWIENILFNNGADDYFLWLLLLRKNIEVTYNPNCLFYHVISESNFSNDDNKMKISSLEVLKYFENNNLLNRNLYIAKRAFSAKIGKKYGFFTSLVSSIIYPDIFLRLLLKKIKKEL